MISVSEALALGALKNEKIVCPYSTAEKHTNLCPCRGTGQVTVCPDCKGAGWNGPPNMVCSGCGGTGCHNGLGLAEKERIKINKKKVGA